MIGCVLIVLIVTMMFDGRGRNAVFCGSGRYAGACPKVGEVRSDLHVPRVLAGRDRVAIVCGSGRYAEKIGGIVSGVGGKIIGVVCRRGGCGRSAGIGSVTHAAR